ncbi:hypothetical protein WJX84_009386 [Apatococcus fuscideae]|uniref:Uncharacterized protein n=1 Tax=Apatococcus fuscideae TaxID=2026836 RepID=A0AAW1SQ12_9CHLO
MLVLSGFGNNGTCEKAQQNGTAVPHIAKVSDETGHLIQEADEEDFEGLLPEEDWVVRGGSNDSLSSNTDLGQAVQSACDELEALGGLEQESLTKANELLRKLGYKGNITKSGK